jgi:hypothetical protein
MNSTLTSAHLDRMAWTIASTGFDTVPAAALRELGFEARRAGIDAVVAHTLADAGAPLVVRQRAFGMIAERLSSRRRGSPGSVPEVHAA